MGDTGPGTCTTLPHPRPAWRRSWNCPLPVRCFRRVGLRPGEAVPVGPHLDRVQPHGDGQAVGRLDREAVTTRAVDVRPVPPKRPGQGTDGA